MCIVERLGCLRYAGNSREPADYEGVDRLMRILKKVGFKIAILSGGFTYFGNYLKQKYNIDYVYANELEVKMES